MSDVTDDGSGEAATFAERDRRVAKLDELRARGVDPYPPRFERDRTLAALRAEFGGLEAGTETDQRVRVAGRIVLLRRQGKLTFATVRDGADAMQLFVSRKVIGDDDHDRFDDLDLGDWVGVEGLVMATRKGELSVKVDGFTLLAKALRPLPDKWHGLVDVDIRYRQRYVDLTVNEHARRVFEIRHRAVGAIRAFMTERGFTEVETPTLSEVQTGATALPFVTHHNALDLDLYLRIALELPLKRLIVGGMDKVFEIGRIWRNEGMDRTHVPEFTMLEAYEAFSDYQGMMVLVEELVAAAATAALGSTTVPHGEGEIDLAPPWPRERMVDLIKDHVGVEMAPSMSVDEARAVLDDLGLEYEDEWGAGKLVFEVYDRRVEPGLVGPVLVVGYPREVSPLAKASLQDPATVERFEAVLAGGELANAYSELNDPIDQRERFEAGAAAKAAGDAEAADIDEDYLRALEYGMPPTGGMGLGIDRLIMTLANVDTVREVILFPTLRPEATP